MEDKTCRTCMDNDDGLCDRIGILVEDEDSCSLHRADWRDRVIEKFCKEE